MTSDEINPRLKWFLINEEEYSALHRAQDGNLFPLADFIEKNGHLSTEEARKFVASLLRGEKPAKRGVKRTLAQQSKELGIWGLIREIQTELGCSEYKARAVFLERHSDVCSNDDSLRTYIRRAKETYEGMTGRKPTDRVQKGRNSEPG
jgi:polyhydroxyalkanoate synthesis regulator phasin